MRKIEKPTVKPIQLYVQFIVRSKEKIYKIMSKEYVYKYGRNVFLYNKKGISKELYTVKSDLYLKEEMKYLYTVQMVDKHKKGRKVYNKIMSLAYLDICPFCGIGQVSTLDHYLPKSKFPIFSVLPYNLVPSCKDCNTGKGISYAKTKAEQTLHPYYDDFTTDQWLFAKVLRTSPISIEFFVDPPSDWDSISKDRVEAHFVDYNLGRRFSIQASSELAKLNSGFSIRKFNFMQIKEQLDYEEQTYKKIHLNSWESALYQALAESDWYCREGYNQNII